MNILDGYNGGVAHITADMVRDHNISMYGAGDVVLDVGNKFDYEIVDNNTITIKDGMAVIGGCRTCITYGKTKTAVVENGTSGYYRNDIICIEFVKDNATLIESTTLKVVKGELTADTGIDPDLVTGDIRAGATVHQMPLYRVKVNGLSIEAVEQMWTAAVVPISHGGLGASTPEEGLSNLGLKVFITERTTDEDGWVITKYSDGTAEAYKDEELTLDMAALGTSSPFNATYVGLINSVTIQSITVATYVMELIKTNMYGWLARMSSVDDTYAPYRFMAINTSKPTPTVKIRHKVTGTWK